MNNTVLNLIKEFPDNWNKVIELINWNDYFNINFSNYNAGIFSVSPLQLIILEHQDLFLHHFKQSEYWQKHIKNTSYTDILNTWKIAIKTKNYEAFDTLVKYGFLPYEKDFEELIQCMASSFYKYSHICFQEEDYEKVYSYLKKYSKQNGVLIENKNGKYYKKKRDNLCSNLLQSNNFSLFYFLFKNKELTKNNLDLVNIIKNINSISNSDCPSSFNLTDIPKNYLNFWSNFYWIFKQKTNSSNVGEALFSIFDTITKPYMDKNFEAFAHLILKESSEYINNKDVLFLSIFNKNKKNINLFKKLNFQISPETWKIVCHTLVQEKTYHTLSSEQFLKSLNEICNNFIIPNFNSYSNEDKIKFVFDQQYIKMQNLENIILKIYQAFLKSVKNKINLNDFSNELNLLLPEKKMIYLEKMTLTKNNELSFKKRIL